jgi:hypothetical protein
MTPELNEGLHPIDLYENHSYQGRLHRITFGRLPASITVDLSDCCMAINIDGAERYWIPLKEINTSSQMLDWIMQIASKTWATPELIGLLVIAFNESLNPQACLCSFGRDLQIKSRDAKRRIEQNLRQVIGWYEAAGNRQLRQAGLRWE